MQAIHDKKSELSQFDTKVILISFVADEEAKLWRKEVTVIIINIQVGVPESEYPFLVDEELDAYNQYGLSKNAQKVWSLKVRSWYWIQRIKGKTLHEIHGDPDQLGGNVNPPLTCCCRRFYN